MVWILHITVEYFREVCHTKKVRTEFKYTLKHTNNQTYLKRFSSVVLRFFSSKICATLVAPDHPPQPTASLVHN